ncbi:hypothetical protein [Halorussus salinus]|uniref:hypothetical protein n=1 Tax=Halorussus salinus TaxID=1364935 RepID=UPI001092568C|nr:hypothetical protein [Halorussus salinus]
MADDPYTDDEYDDTYKEVHRDEPRRDQYAGDAATEESDDRRGDGFWDVGIVTALVLGGLALVVFPEPATTITGVLLVTIGVSLAVLNAVG